MTKRPKDQDMPPVDRVLRDVFEIIEGQPVPDSIKDHLDRLIDGTEERDEQA